MIMIRCAYDKSRGNKGNVNSENEGEQRVGGGCRNARYKLKSTLRE